MGALWRVYDGLNFFFPWRIDVFRGDSVGKKAFKERMVLQSDKGARLENINDLVFASVRLPCY